MADYGFYGGRRGQSFILKTNFPTIQAMIDAFSQGKAYEDVSFDEYVIIDTADKGNDDNGKIYRRGYDYTNDMGGAEYICQIKGGGGASPHLLLTTIDNIESLKAQSNVSFSGEGEYSHTDNNLIPGKDGDAYNDSIKWAYCSVKNPDGTDTISYIGFAFPYTVIDYEAESVSPYYNRDNETEDSFKNINLTERLDTSEHPFYEKWKIKIPKGIKGDSIQNVRVMTADSTIEEYVGQQDDIDNQRQVIVLDEIVYNKFATGETKTLYLGDYNMIKSLSMDEDGHITIHYTHGEDQIISVIARWITAVHLSEDGKLSIDYTTGESTQVENIIKWIDNIHLSDEGNLVVTYNDGTSDIIQQGIKWITDVSLAQDGTFKIEFGNNLEPYQTKIKYPSSLAVDVGESEGEGTQKLKVSYNDSSNELVGNPINYIMKVAITEDDFHVLLLYSDPEKRQEIVQSGKNREYDGRNDWYDLGAVKDASGILIGANFDSAHFTEGTSNIRIITQLNQEYPNGFPATDIDKHGKVVTVGDEDEQKKFFAFNYDKKEDGTYKGWYFVGDASAAGPITQTQGIIVGYEDDQDLIEQAEDLPIGTVWMILED